MVAARTLFRPNGRLLPALEPNSPITVLDTLAAKSVLDRSSGKAFTLYKALSRLFFPRIPRAETALGTPALLPVPTLAVAAADPADYVDKIAIAVFFGQIWSAVGRLLSGIFETKAQLQLAGPIQIPTLLPFGYAVAPNPAAGAPRLLAAPRGKASAPAKDAVEAKATKGDRKKAKPLASAAAKAKMKAKAAKAKSKPASKARKSTARPSPKRRR